MTPRSVALITRPGIQRHGSGLVTYDVGADHIGAAIEPFIFVSLYDMTGPTFPPHPHAGFSVATYILPESPIGFINQDSLGNRNRIAPGALHVTVAGSGVIHEEQPEKPGAAARGFQIWIDHRAADREIAPHALHVRNDAMPSVRDAGMTGRVVLGEVLGNTAPVAAPPCCRCRARGRRRTAAAFAEWREYIPVSPSRQRDGGRSIASRTSGHRACRRWRYNHRDRRTRRSTIDIVRWCTARRSTGSTGPLCGVGLWPARSLFRQLSRRRVRGAPPDRCSARLDPQ